MERKTKVIFCGCENKGQDELHGKGNRVHNWAGKINSGSGGWRCTVCNSTKQQSITMKNKENK